MLDVLLCVAFLVSASSAQVLPTNVAVNKTATQSTTFDSTDQWMTPPLTYRAEARLAVDGRDTKAYPDKTCAVTDWKNTPACTDNPWWQVDLGVLHYVFNVTIFQRGEGEAPGRENYGPLVVHVGDHVERPENRTRYNDTSVVSVPLSPPVTASTVNISIIGCAILILCEVEVYAVRHEDECKTKPCLHGGICLDTWNGYTCTCVPGYTGVSCSTDVDECALGYCQNGATCSNTAGSYSCSCGVGYSGRNCSSDIDECALGYCQNGGSCSNTPGSYACDCAAGFTGDKCSRDIDECALAICQNGATCMNTQGSYSCICVAGFEGQNCSTDVDECASSPCPQNSLCVEGINTYSCHCATGYTGLRCNQPCSGGTFGPECRGTCSPHCLESSDGGGQHCDHVTGQCLLQTGCKDGFQGPTCSIKEQIDRLAEGVGIGLGVGLGTSLLLALAIFVLHRFRRHRNPSSEGTSMGDVQMSSRQMEAEARQQRNVAHSQESRDYETLNNATKDCNLPSPYSELGEIKETQSVCNPYNN